MNKEVNMFWFAVLDWNVGDYAILTNEMASLIGKATVKCPF